MLSPQVIPDTTCALSFVLLIDIAREYVVGYVAYMASLVNNTNGQTSICQASVKICRACNKHREQDGEHSEVASWCL